MKAEILQKISEEQITQIKEWLNNEQKKSNTGFYCNWNTILRAIEANEVYCVSIKNQIAAFLIWNTYDLTIRINIAEVKPGMRRKGIGKFLVNSALEYFKAQGFMVADLECNPPSSESFWRNMEFVDFPTIENINVFEQGDVRLYKNLYPRSEITKALPSDEVIEIWQKEPIEVRRAGPDWTWVIKYKDEIGNLENPIIQPCKKDWKIRWRKGRDIYEDKKVKYFGGLDICHGDFIIIQHLPPNNGK